MFKQHKNTMSNLVMTNASNYSSQQSYSKNSDIQNFSHLLKKLETQNVNIDQLRLLKTQHTYLQKLRNQRQKIEQLRSKYTQCEQNLSKYQEENKNQILIIQDYQSAIELLKQELENERQKRIQLQNNFINKNQVEKEKLRFRISQLNKQLEDHKKIIKNKDVLIMQLQQESEQKIKEVKQHFMEAKKRLVVEIEQKLRVQLEEKSQFENELVELRNLVTRQNKALKQQNQKYQQLSQSHTKLAQQLERCNEQITNLTIVCEQYEEKMENLQSTNQKLTEGIKEMNHNAQNQGQLQELRKRMAQMAKGEIQKIEFIVNQFE